MTVFKKLVLFTEQVGDKTLEQIGEDCVVCFGNYLGQNYESRDVGDWDPQEQNLVEYTRRHDGNVITINTSCINYEWELPLFQYDNNMEILTGEFLANQTDIEVPDIMDREAYDECISKTENMLRTILKKGNGTTLYIKIFKIGNVDYYCFSV